MKREILMARLLRALAGKSQERMGEEVGIHPSLLAHYEAGKGVPGRDYLEKLARGAGITVDDASQVLDFYESLRLARRRVPEDAEKPLWRLVEELRSQAESAYRRILALPLPLSPPTAEDRQRGEELWNRLADLSPDGKLAVVRLAREFQTWALCERLCTESERGIPRDTGRAVELARLAQEVAERVPGPPAWRSRLRGYAAAHAARALQAGGDPGAAEALGAEAERLWQEGADPEALLDPGSLLQLAGEPAN
jgi:transcriptional regulator with XRE-family HTH domain